MNPCFVELHVNASSIAVSIVLLALRSSSIFSYFECCFRLSLNFVSALCLFRKSCNICFLVLLIVILKRYSSQSITLILLYVKLHILTIAIGLTLLLNSLIFFILLMINCLSTWYNIFFFL